MKKYLILFVFIICNTLIAQTFQVHGRVVDSTGNGLDHASVILLDHTDSTVLHFRLSDNSGNFEFNKIQPGKYLLQISYTGFQTYWKKVNLETGQTLMDLGILTLQSKMYVLPVMEIKAEHNPIKFGKDTVEYNTRAFKTQPGDVVEDLLKKLPGIDVERDGSVKAYGQKVQNVLVDGKEFFGKDTRIATKNLEADAVDKVQVFDKKSEQAAFTGVDDGQEEKTINLQLKENKKRGYFGNVNGGAGTDERYSAKSNINRFTSGSRFSFVGSANNINEQSFSIQDYIDFMGGIGAFMNGSSGGVRIELNSDSGLPFLGSGQIPGIQNTKAGGINYSSNPSEKTEMTGSFFYNTFSNKLSDYIFRQNTGDAFNYSTTENQDQNSKSDNKSINYYLKYKPDSIQYFTFRLNGSLTNSDIESNSISTSFQSLSQLLNGSQSNYFMNGNNNQVKGSLNWLRKLHKPGRSISAQVSTHLQNNARSGMLTSVNQYYTVTNITDSIHQRQDLNDDVIDLDASLRFTEPLGRKRYLDFNLSHSEYRHKTNNEFFDILENEKELENTILSKRYNSTYNINSGGLHYMMNRKQYHFTAGVKFQSSILTGQFNSQNTTNLKKYYTNILPDVFGEYQFGPANHIHFEYRTMLQQPSIEQLQPAINNSDPLNIYVGNPELNPEYIHELAANYFLYDQFNFTSLFVNASGGYTTNRITNIVHIDSAFRRIIQPVNVSYEKSIRAGIDFSEPVRPLFINARIRLNTSLSDGILYVNEVRNKVARSRNYINFSIENRNKDIVDAEIGWKYTKNKTAYSVSSINNQHYGEIGYYTNISIALSDKVSLKSNFEYRNFTSSLFDEHLAIPLWEMNVSHYFLKDNKLKLQLRVFDILNENKGIRRTSQLNYVEEERSNVPGRYCMLQLGYSIRGFSASKKSGLEIKVEH